MNDEEIRRLDDEVRAAMLGRDVEALKRLCSEDFIVTNPFNQVLDMRQMLEAVESGRIKHTAFEREIEHLRAGEGAAVVTGREMVVDGGRTFNRRYTEMWMMRGGRWQLVARHASNV